METAVPMIEYTVSDGVCVLRLRAPPVNAITFALLEQLRAAIDRANLDPEVGLIILTGSPDHFSAGADVGLFRDIKRPEEAVRTSRVFQEAFQAVEDSPKPIAAAVAGHVMGGALELAMACHGRVCTAATRFSMPEVNLGIVPGAGGTQRLPRLVGATAALEMLLTGKAVDAKRAHALGLVNAVCEGDDLLGTALAVLRPTRAEAGPATAGEGRSAAGLSKTSLRTDKTSGADNEAAFREAEERLASVRPEIIAPRVILEAVRSGLAGFDLAQPALSMVERAESFQAGLRKEQEGFARCMGTPATQNKIYLFFATRETSKIPGLAAGATADITQAAVIGMGSMGTGIAQALIASGIRVVAIDRDASALEKGAERIRGSILKRAEEGGLAPGAAKDMLGLLSTAADWREAARSQIVIEAVFEDVAVKRAVIREVETACGDGAIIASNTSTISLDVLAEGMQRPERLIGMHFFNPAHRMPLVEVIRREATPAAIVATAMRFAKVIRKTPVLVRNREGFLVNRLFIPYLKEAFRLLEEGADPARIDAAMVEFGFPMGPLTLIDMAGLDVLVLTDRVLTAALPAHGPLSQVAVRLVERGRLGQKSGSGVYEYQKGDRTARPSAETAAVIAEVQRAEGRPPRRMEAGEIVRRLVLRMVGEAFCVMEEGIAERESDIDVATVLGIGFPDFRGGVLRYARDLGPGNVLADLQVLAAEHGPRFSPCPLLRNMKGIR
jgi:3-hydroxyacyl-CoA dehydrogenase